MRPLSSLFNRVPLFLPNDGPFFFFFFTKKCNKLMTKKTNPLMSSPPRHLFQAGQMWKSAHKGEWGGFRVNLRRRSQTASNSTFFFFFFSCRDEEKEIKEGKESNLFPQRRAGAFRSQTMGRWKSALPLMAPGSTAAAWRQFVRLDKWLQGKIAPTCQALPCRSIRFLPAAAAASLASKRLCSFWVVFFLSSCW